MLETLILKQCQLDTKNLEELSIPQSVNTLDISLNGEGKLSSILVSIIPKLPHLYVLEAR